MAKKKQNKKSNKIVYLYLFIFLVATGLLVLVLGKEALYRTNAQGGDILILYPNPDNAKPNLQLQTFSFITLPPMQATPVQGQAPTSPPSKDGYCGLDEIKPQGSDCTCMDMNAIACPVEQPAIGAPNCPSGQIPFQLPIASSIWYCIELKDPGMINPNPPPPPAGCFAACIAKPVIYLYPEVQTNVDVAVEAPGEVFISDPLYPEGGWKDVTAYPDGNLVYQGNQYGELFYETNVTKEIPRPEEGFVIPMLQLRTQLAKYTTQLGLQGREQEEFLDYWIPVLEKEGTPYVFFSVLSPEVKESVDKVILSPEPDTRIEIIAYFSPMQKYESMPVLKLPTNPPARHGFTMVEWGGTLIK